MNFRYGVPAITKYGLQNPIPKYHRVVVGNTRAEMIAELKKIITELQEDEAREACAAFRILYEDEDDNS